MMKPEIEGASEFAARQPQKTIEQIRFNKAREKLQALTDNLEAVANFKDDLREQMQFAWAMTPRQYDMLARAVAAFAAFARLCDVHPERSQERRAA